MLSSFKKLIILFMGAVLFAGSVGAVSASAASRHYSTATHAVGIMFKGGPGHAGSVWAGTWNNGTRGFCLDFGKSTPNRAGISVITGNVPGMTAEESKRAKSIANKYSATTSRNSAANAGFAIWRLQHDSSFNTWYRSARSRGVVSTARHNAINAILADAAQHAPYKMKVGTTQVLVGQTGSGAVKVLGSNSRPAVGRKVSLTATNGRILSVNGRAGSTGTTRSSGVVFTYQRTNAGKVTFKATLSSPSSARAGKSISSSGHQRTLSGRSTEGAVATYDYNKAAGWPTIAAACDTNCNGQSRVTFRFANPSGTQAIKWTERVGSLVVATLNAKAGTTGTVVIPLTDGKVITTSSYCYTGSVVGGPCKTATVHLPATPTGPYEIVCPAWALGELIAPCKCALNQPVSAMLTAPAGSPRFYRGYISVNNGAVVYQRDLVNGQRTTWSTGTLGKGAKAVLSFTIYRDAARKIPMGSHTLGGIQVN